MGNQNSIEVENVKKVNGITIGFNEKSFLIVFNGDENGENGDTYAIPVNFIGRITQGFVECGLEYQKQYGKNIGFDKSQLSGGNSLWKK